MKTFVQKVNDFNQRIGIFASWFSGLLVLLVIYDVVMRYFFQHSSPWIMELEWHLFSLMFLLGAAYTFQVDKHVRVDLFYTKLSAVEKARTNLLGNLLFLLPWCIFIIVYSFDYAWASFQMGEGSPDPGGLPYRFIIKFTIVLGFFLLAMQAIANSISAFQLIRNAKEN